MDKLSEEYTSILNSAVEMLDKNDEWEKRYGEYINTIVDGYYSNQEKFLKGILKINWPMSAYITISQATKSGVSLDLRLLGTSIATLNVASNGLTNEEKELIKLAKYDRIDRNKINKIVTVSFKEKGDAFASLVGGGKPNSQIVKTEFINQEWDLELVEKLLSEENNKYRWHDPLIIEFRSMVKKVYEKNGFCISGEHAYESSILKAMKGSSRYFYCLRPVLLEDSFFQMPTPFTASHAMDGEISYSAHYGGGIDILARKKLGAQNELCVIELKDNYESGEEPKQAIKQAIVYSVFLLRLIKSETAGGDKWLDYFRIHRKSDSLNINAVIAMPFKDNSSELSYEDTFFAGKELPVKGLGTITLHYMYFDRDIFKNIKHYNPEKIAISIPRNKLEL